MGDKDTMTERALFGPGVAQVSHFECSNERLEMKPGGSEASYEQVRILPFQPRSPVFVYFARLWSRSDVTHGMKVAPAWPSDGILPLLAVCARRCKSCGRS